MFGSPFKLTRPLKGRRWLLVALICVTLFSFIIYSFQQVVNVNSKLVIRYADANTDTTTTNSTTGPELLIVDQPSCKIPKTEIWPKYFKRAWKVNHQPDCSYERRLAVLEEDDHDEEILRLLQTQDIADANESKDCCVSEITRENPLSDHGYNLSFCLPLRPSTSMNVHGKQMFLIRCGNRLNFEATIPVHTTKCKAKVKHWKDQLERTSTSTESEPPPISVLILGIDSVSRSHAYRSLPQSLDYMTSKMGFIDFQGYHSIADSTLPNFMAFLMGLPQSEVRRTCAPDWDSTWDECPLIWKEFDKANYVTMYIEDGNQTFNWGGQGGFSREPTDYYLHPLCVSLRQLRTEHSKIPTSTSSATDDQKEEEGCMSTETVPQFMLGHTRMFVDKFSPSAKTATSPPFFAFTWLEDPFHDDMYTVPTLDKEFLDFMQHLNSESSRSMLESTLIVLVSDHGERYSFFHSTSIESYVERSLPPLFIRLPEQFRARFPDYSEALRWNAAHRLVTPFDLHHTMLHLLQLDRRTRSRRRDNFTAVLKDRSSLFQHVEGSRTCEQLGLAPESCVCNLAINLDSAGTVSNPFILTRLMDFVQDELNEVVVAYGYEEWCEEWSTTGIESVLSAHLLQKEVHAGWFSSSTSLDVLLKFKADPLEAYFEVKVRIWLNVSHLEWLRAELLGSFIRINKYGDQSWCIQGKTDQDKKMKALCVCKHFFE